jgi:hypothetical protein
MQEITALERPKTALITEEDVDERGKAIWLSEKNDRLLELKQLESKAFNLSRELKHKARMQASETSQLKFQLQNLQQLID